MRRGSLIALACALGACAAPRSITQSGRVTPPGDVRLGVAVPISISSSTSGAIYDGLQGQIEDLDDGDIKLETREDLDDLIEPLLAHGLDPVGTGTDLFLRVGVYDRFDLGYRYASGTHVFDTMFQFMGPIGEEQPETRVSGAVGVQYSRQEYEAPSLAGLDTLQSLLDYRFERTDLLFPVVLSYGFGENEEYGALGFGVAYNYTSISYGIESEVVHELFEDELEAIDPPSGESSVHAFGGFVNVKAGYVVYALFSLAVYYQDFGSYKLFSDKKRSLSGTTVIPTFGVQAEF